MIWKTLYSQSFRDHGTLGYFKSLLNRASITKDPKKDVNSTVDFLLTVVKGHMLAAACQVLGVTKLDSKINLPPCLGKSSVAQQYAYLQTVAAQVVDQCTLIEGALTGESVMETEDGVYNYARVLCHFGSLIMEVRDAWEEGAGKRMTRCWRLLLPQFKAADRRKYALEALRLQFQIKATLSPYLAHQLTWNQFVNTHGGAGRNIPCDLHNEHLNKLVKSIITNQGANFTETALQRAARSVTTLQTVSAKFDQQSNVPPITHSHSTKSLEQDVAKVVSTILKQEILLVKPGRKHSSYPTLRTNPLWNWDLSKTEKWIESKKDYYKYRGTVLEPEANVDEIDLEDD